MHWYLVHTKPRQEKCALENLERQGYACYLPTLLVEKLHKERLTVIEEPLFPRYLFIRLGHEVSAKSWAPIRSTRGVCRLVSFGVEPAKVDDSLIDHLKDQAARTQSAPQPLFTPGERVRLTDAPFAGVEGLFQMIDGEQRAMVLIELLSRQVRVPAAPASLRKAS